MLGINWITIDIQISKDYSFAGVKLYIFNYNI
jgi:hypothetical protein